MRSQGRDTIDEMVFENRNKEYGSYRLRKKYYIRVGIGFAVSLTVFLTLSLISYWYYNVAGDENIYVASGNSPYLKTVPGSLLTKEELDSYMGRSEKPPSDVPATKPSQSEKNFVITDKPVEQFIPPPEEPKDANLENDPGGLFVDDSTAFGGFLPGDGSGIGGSGAFDRIPEFPGGNATLYVEKNLKYPPLAIKQKIHGIVIVSFVINKSGKVTNVKVEKGVNPIIDQEAIKTIQNMPVWKPGMMHGKPINFLFRMPINFMPVG
jgi:protein TonB